MLRNKNGIIFVNIEIYSLKNLAILKWVDQTWPLLVNFPLVQGTSAGVSQNCQESCQEAARIQWLWQFGKRGCTLESPLS